VDLVTGEVSGVEALIRWQHPHRGLLPPDEFLPVAERSGLIEPLTDWVLRRALDDQAQWRAAGLPWTVAVNVSARNLQSARLHRTVRELISADGGTAERLHLEVTETALAMDTGVAAEVVAALAGEGLRIAIDDFGIGYTSQDRPHVRLRPGGQRPGPRHRPLRHRARAQSRVPGDRRRGRDARCGRVAHGRRMRRRARVLVVQASALVRARRVSRHVHQRSRAAQRGGARRRPR
jgi:hypothetical protein